MTEAGYKRLRQGAVSLVMLVYQDVKQCNCVCIKSSPLSLPAPWVRPYHWTCCLLCLCHYRGPASCVAGPVWKKSCQETWHWNSRFHLPTSFRTYLLPFPCHISHRASVSFLREDPENCPPGCSNPGLSSQPASWLSSTLPCTSSMVCSTTLCILFPATPALSGLGGGAWRLSIKRKGETNLHSLRQ